MKRILLLSLLSISFFLNTKAQGRKDYLRYIDSVNIVFEPHPGVGQVKKLSYKPGVGFGDFHPKPYHIAFNFNSKDIKDFYWLCMEEFDKAGMIDSLLIDTTIACSGEKTRLYLPQKLPFKLQSAILKAMAKQVSAVDEIVLADKIRNGNFSRRVLIGGGDLNSYYSDENYIRKFSSIKAIAKAQSQEELLQLFKELDDKKPNY